MILNKRGVLMMPEEKRSCREDDFGERVAALLRAGSWEQYNEVQKFVLQSLTTGDRVCGDMIMDVIWSLLPKTAPGENRCGPALETHSRACARISYEVPRPR